MMAMLFSGTGSSDSGLPLLVALPTTMAELRLDMPADWLPVGILLGQPVT